MGRQRRDEDVEGQREFWRLVLETWRDSGLSIVAFCRREGLAASSFHQWRKRLASAAEEAATPVFVPVKVGLAEEPERVMAVEAAGYCSVSDFGELSRGAIELVLTCGVRVQVREGFEAATLRRVVEALR